MPMFCQISVSRIRECVYFMNIYATHSSFKLHGKVDHLLFKIFQMSEEDLPWKAVTPSVNMQGSRCGVFNYKLNNRAMMPWESLT